MSSPKLCYAKKSLAGMINIRNAIESESERKADKRVSLFCIQSPIGLSEETCGRSINSVQLIDRDQKGGVTSM